jgi:hypothetical protein
LPQAPRSYSWLGYWMQEWAGTDSVCQLIF